MPTDFENASRKGPDRRNAPRSRGGGPSAHELEIALEEIQALWDELGGEGPTRVAREARAQWRRSFDRLPLACLITDNLGNVLEANLAAARAARGAVRLPARQAADHLHRRRGRRESFRMHLALAGARPRSRSRPLARARLQVLERAGPAPREVRESKSGGRLPRDEKNFLSLLWFSGAISSSPWTTTRSRSSPRSMVGARPDAPQSSTYGAFPRPGAVAREGGGLAGDRGASGRSCATSPHVAGEASAKRYSEFFEYAPDAYLITDSHGQRARGEPRRGGAARQSRARANRKPAAGERRFPRPARRDFPAPAWCAPAPSRNGGDQRLAWRAARSEGSGCCRCISGVRAPAGSRRRPSPRCAGWCAAPSSATCFLFRGGVC